MTLTALEAAVNALHTYLSTNMAAKVSDLNTRYTDTMASIKIWYKGNLPTVIPEYPSVAIVGNSWTPKRQMAVALHVTNEIRLTVFYGDEDLEVRFNRLCRYALGLVELCHTGEASIGYQVHFKDAIAVTDVLDAQPFIQGIIIPVILEKSEEF
jgi:hypothetical protein